MHEASLYPFNCFVTLTYDDAHLPADGSLDHRHFQLFLKRLRFHFSPQLIRYYMCGEYGDINRRPHYHACLFNVHFPDQTIWRKTEADNYIYSSPTLTNLWPLGHTSIGALNSQTAAYTARYVMQKVTGKGADHYYNGRTPEYNRMSLRPGIGAEWYSHFYRDIYPRDYLVLVGGNKTTPPSYYDKLLERQSPETYRQVVLDRSERAAAHFEDQTTPRLIVRDTVTKARIRNLHRSL